MKLNKTNYKYIHFRPVENNTYSCRNNKSDEQLGYVRYYHGWKQWCFFPTARAVYSYDCLDDISHFLNQLNSKE